MHSSTRTIFFNTLNDATSWSNAYIIRSYPGEWAVIDASSYSDARIFVFQGTDITGHIGFIEFSHLEIRNAHGATHSAAISTRGGPFKFRYLYIHNNTCDTGSNNPAGLQLTKGVGDSIIEYNYFKGNGYLGNNENSANVAIYSDYKTSWGTQQLYDSVTGYTTARHDNTIKYN